MASSSKKYVRKLRLQNVLGVICAVLILASFFSPWWGVNVISGWQRWSIAVFPHGVYGDILPYGFGRPYAGSPIFMIFTGVFAVCIFLCLLGSILKGKKGKALLLTTGAILLIIVYVFNYRIALACSNVPGAGISIPVEGKAGGEQELGEWEYAIYTGFQFGYYLAILAGSACIISPLLVYMYEKLRQRPGKRF